MSSLALAVTVSLSFGLMGCGDERSVEAYCGAVARHKERYLSAMSAANGSGGLESLLRVAAAVSDLKSMWQDMAKVAPSDIQTDSETVADSWDKVADAAANQNWVGAGAYALMGAGAMQRVDSYVASNCGAEYSFTGRGSTTDQASSTAAPVEGGEPSPSTTPEESSEPDDGSGLSFPSSESGWNRSDVSVFSGCTGDLDADLPTDGQVLDPVGGSFVDLPLPPVPDGDEVAASACTVAGQADDLHAVFYLKTRTPATGLDAEEFHRNVWSLPLAGGAPQSERWRGEAEPKHLYPVGDTVIAAVATDTYSDPDVVAAFDAVSGKQLYRKKEALVGQTAGAIAVGNYDDGVSVLDPRSGATIFRVADADPSFVVSLDSQLSITRPQAQNDDGTTSYPYTLYDAAQRKVVKNDLPDLNLSVVQSGDRLLFRDNSGFAVTDLSGHTEVERFGTKYEKLHIDAMSAIDDYLYLDTTDGPSVVNSTTGKQVATQWATRPTDRLGSRWTIVSSAEKIGQNPTCFAGAAGGALSCDSDVLTLVRHGSDGRFPGPWF